MSQQLLPTKPYLVRAVYDWCVDSGLTPYVVVAVDGRTRVPKQYVREGQIVLNIAPYATSQLQISNDDLSCQARFGGVAQSLYVPLGNIMAIYARENGRGMAFNEGHRWGTGMELGGVLDDEPAEGPEAESAPATPALESVATSPDQPPSPDAPKPGPGAGPRLRVIK